MERAAALHDTAVLRTFLRTVPTWRGVLVLNYHRVGEAADQPWDRGMWSTTAEGFDEHLAYLSRHIDVVGVADLQEVVGRKRGRHVLLTFDDGYRDNYEVAFPLLQRHGLPATFFLSTGFLDAPAVAWWDEISWMVRHAQHDLVVAGPGLPVDVPLTGPDDELAVAILIEHYKSLPGDRTDAFLEHIASGTGAGRCDPALAAPQWMTWDMAREMQAAGMTLGGHTVTHPILGRLTPDEQEQEIAVCAERMRAETGRPMRWFSYPVGSRGSFDQPTREALRRNDVEIAFSFYGGYLRFDRWDPYDVRRVHVGPRLSRQLLQSLVGFPQLFARPS
jgi:peptidoglycan/xylan/chitin deacetylase (PgdA/CDA1 family)